MSYARVSTTGQADKELSIPAQLAAMRQYASQRNRTIIEEFIEPGVSARTADRPQLKRLLGRCQDANPLIEGVMSPAVYRLAAIRLQEEGRALSGRICPSYNEGVSSESLVELMETSHTLWQLHTSLSLPYQRRLLPLVFEDLLLDYRGVSGFVLRPPFISQQLSAKTAA